MAVPLFETVGNGFDVHFMDKKDAGGQVFTWVLMCHDISLLNVKGAMVAMDVDPV